MKGEGGREREESFYIQNSSTYSHRHQQPRGLSDLAWFEDFFYFYFVLMMMMLAVVVSGFGVVALILRLLSSHIR